MDFEQYSERARGFVQSAQAMALREGHQRFTPGHMLKVLLDDSEGLAGNLIRRIRDLACNLTGLVVWTVLKAAKLRRANCSAALTSFVEASSRHRSRRSKIGCAISVSPGLVPTCLASMGHQDRHGHGTGGWFLWRRRERARVGANDRSHP